jgi:hypothetical protein
MRSSITRSVQPVRPARCVRIAAAPRDEAPVAAAAQRAVAAIAAALLLGAAPVDAALVANTPARQVCYERGGGGGGDVGKGAPTAGFWGG